MVVVLHFFNGNEFFMHHNCCYVDKMLCDDSKQTEVMNGSTIKIKIIPSFCLGQSSSFLRCLSTFSILCHSLSLVILSFIFPSSHSTFSFSRFWILSLCLEFFVLFCGIFYWKISSLFLSWRIGM